VLRIHDPKLIPLLKSCKGEFQALHNGRCLISTAKRRWVTKAIFAEWAELFCEWLERRRVDLGLQNKPAILVLDNAPTPACARASETFRPYNVHVVTFPPHMAHVAEVNVDRSGRVPDDGDSLVDAESDVGPRHTNGCEEGEVDVRL
jgi:hypothetical protein